MLTKKIHVKRLTERKRYVYLAVRADGFLKVGISTRPLERVKAFGDKRTHREKRPPLANNDTPVGVKVIRTAAGDFAAEKQVQEALSEYAVGACTEWFHDTEASRAAAHEAMSKIGPDLLPAEGPSVFVGLRLPKSLWTSIRLEAIQREVSAEQLVIEIVNEFVSNTK